MKKDDPWIWLLDLQQLKFDTNNPRILFKKGIGFYFGNSVTLIKPLQIYSNMYA